MKIRKILIVLVLAVALLGCGKQESRHFVIMPDVSGSIDRESLEQAFKAIDELAGHLQRGDRLTVIPILGDAEAESSGKILRFEIPANRQAYDTDLRDFRRKLNVSLKEMQANAIVHPGSRTDILGSISLAEQEFRITHTTSNQTLIILSDFIEEDATVNFMKDPQLADIHFAKRFGMQIASKTGIDFRKVLVYLCSLRSTEYTAIKHNRRAAIREFWVGYFEASQSQPQFVTDGPGLMKEGYGR